MTIRRALFLGGALLVLTACSDTTAPANAKRAGGMANTKLKPAPTTTFTTMSTSGCRGGYVVTAGRDSTGTPSDSSCAGDQ